MLEADRFERWIRTERGGNIALSLVTAAIVVVSAAAGYLLGRRGG